MALERRSGSWVRDLERLVQSLACYRSVQWGFAQPEPVLPVWLNGEPSPWTIDLVIAR